MTVQPWTDNKREFGYIIPKSTLMKVGVCMAAKVH